ncbi:MAG TPA: FHA domain-containing protein [Bryobacteraceae bacterium]|nr:FHA domain-containing protein [Bryobacteraceae bacterium]
MSRLHELERRIDEKLRGLLRSNSQESGEKRELIEVHRAILDEIATRVDLLPRGRRVFAYPQLTVQVLLPDLKRRRSYELIFVEADALARDIRLRLEDDAVELPARFRVEVELVEDLPEDVSARGFDVLYQSGEGRSAQAAVPEISLTVLSGQAGQPVYQLRRNRVNLGRLANVLDSRERLVRRNDVAFEDQSGEPNSTVSRSHAHLEFDAMSAQYRLFDDRSAYGTTVLRGGGVVPVPKGASKGVPLEPGDEILLGQARLRFEYICE